jgi:defect-in-organelle-trafficking protein DotC
MKLSRLAISISVSLAVLMPRLGFAESDLDLSSVITSAKRELSTSGKPNICNVISAKACSILHEIKDVDFEFNELDGEDRILLSEAMAMSVEDVQSYRAQVVSNKRRNIISSVALQLGVSVGVARESTYYNRLWEKNSWLYDQTVRFDALMLNSDFARNIVPAVISLASSYSTIGNDGKTFRAAGKIYTIKIQPRFTETTPSWRDYLHLGFEAPLIPSTALLPVNNAEKKIFNVNLVKGYWSGIKLAESRAKVAYARLASDFNGMIRYHLMLSYKMISKPIVTSTYSPVSINVNRDEMALDDSILHINVEPMFNSDLSEWKALPLIHDFPFGNVTSQYKARKP